MCVCVCVCVLFTLLSIHFKIVTSPFHYVVTYKRDIQFHMQTHYFVCLYVSVCVCACVLIAIPHTFVFTCPYPSIF